MLYVWTYAHYSVFAGVLSSNVPTSKREEVSNAGQLDIKPVFFSRNIDTFFNVIISSTVDDVPAVVTEAAATVVVDGVAS